MVHTAERTGTGGSSIGSPDKVEVELLLYFCRKMRDGNFKRRPQPVLWNLYQRQVARIHKALKTLHEDLRYDYEEAIEEL